VREGREALSGGSSDSLAGGIRCPHLREVGFQRQQASEKTVVLSVRDFRTGEHIVEVVVSLDETPKLLGFDRGLFRAQGLGRSLAVRTFFLQGTLLNWSRERRR
jgi:hypothetical protein